MVAPDERREDPLRDRLAVGVQAHQDRQRETRHAGLQAAHVARQRLGQHRQHHVRQVHAVSAPQRLLVEQGARLDVVRDVGDVDAELEAVLVRLERERVVVVARVGRVDGRREHVAQVQPPADRAARRNRRALRLQLHFLGELQRQAQLERHHLAVPAGLVGAAQVLDHPNPLAFAAPHRGQAQRRHLVAGLEVAGVFQREVIGGVRAVRPELERAVMADHDPGQRPHPVLQHLDHPRAVAAPRTGHQLGLDPVPRQRVPQVLPFDEVPRAFAHHEGPAFARGFELGRPARPRPPRAPAARRRGGGGSRPGAPPLRGPGAALHRDGPKGRGLMWSSSLAKKEERLRTNDSGRGPVHRKAAARGSALLGLPGALLVPIEATALLALVRRDLLPFTLFSATHSGSFRS